MKKLLTVLICALVIFCTVAFSACGKTGKIITVYVPDGAPALALAELMHEEKFGKDVSYRVVGANEIESCVTYVDENKNADLCILPVNSASKFLGDGERYKLLGAVTHGNLFIVAGKEKQELTRDNFAERVAGKKIGVVNLPAFPGAVLKLILNKYGVTDAVLENVQPSEVTGVGSDYDYFVLPEPAASTRAGNANLNLKIVGSLQTLYGENGYPQAVLVAKNGLIEDRPDFIRNFVEAVSENSSWLMEETVGAETIISAITSHYADPDNTAPGFNAKNLTKEVISNCAVWFENLSDCHKAVDDILKELKSAGDGKAVEVSENFYYYFND